MLHMLIFDSTRSSFKAGRIEMNFNKILMKVFCEMYYWERMRFEIPHYSREIYMKREQLRILRENVMLVMRDYNHIISNLQSRERALFRERIRSLDKKLQPGFTKLTWESDGVLEYFVVECRAHAYKVLSLINNYKVITQNMYMYMYIYFHI